MILVPQSRTFTNNRSFSGDFLSMPSETPLVSGPDTAPGLPPVVPPSGKFIAQLFLVPFLLVSAVVGLLLLVNWFVRGGQTPRDFLTKLDNSNPDVRWRGAEDLAQVLLRDDTLASDLHFGLDLAQRLREAWQNLLSEEKVLAGRNSAPAAGEPDREREALEPERDHILYLSACLGNLTLPVGAPVLAEMAASQEGGDIMAVFQRRRQALWALANLGKNLQRFARLSEATRQTAESQLAEEAAASQPERSDWARRALQYRAGSQAHSLYALGVEQAIVRCAEDDNPYLREISALALNFWDGLPTENSRLDALLDRLAHDDGHGEEIIAGFRSAEEARARMNKWHIENELPVIKVPGLTIQCNANIALARRASPKARPAALEQMLHPDWLRDNLQVRRPDGKETPDANLAFQVLETTLQAVADLHRKQPQRDLSVMRPAVKALVNDRNPAVRAAAEQTLKVLDQ
jgi:hypothetical protein